MSYKFFSLQPHVRIHTKPTHIYTNLCHLNLIERHARLNGRQQHGNSHSWCVRFLVCFTRRCHCLKMLSFSVCRLTHVILLVLFVLPSSTLPVSLSLSRPLSLCMVRLRSFFYFPTEIDLIGDTKHA